MSKIGIKFVDGGKVFCCETDLELNIGDRVIVESVRGLELAYVSACAKEEEQEEIKSIVRLATEEDLKTEAELKTRIPKVTEITNELIAKYNLDMKLVDMSYTIDGTKLIINYVCEDRVDFRELVKDLASQLKLRIELRQIGIRDQAKIVGGIGFCGKECCCKKYLNDFDKVSIKMAKTQGLSLNPTKISGICGRLMCCLSYENEFYAEISAKMPKINARVRTKDGVGTVIYNNLLKQKVTVRVENDNDVRVQEYEIADIEVIPKVQPEQVSKDANKKKEEQRPQVEKTEQKENNQTNKKKNFNNFKKKKKNNESK